MQESTTDFWTSNPDFAQADNYSVERTIAAVPAPKAPFADAEKFPSLLVDNFNADPKAVQLEQITEHLAGSKTETKAKIIAEQDFDVLAEYRRLFAALNVRLDGDIGRIAERVSTTTRRVDALEAVVPTVYMQQQDIAAITREMQHVNVKLLTLQNDLDMATRPWYVKMNDFLRSIFYVSFGSNPVTRESNAGNSNEASVPAIGMTTKALSDNNNAFGPPQPSADSSSQSRVVPSVESTQSLEAAKSE